MCSAGQCLVCACCMPALQVELRLDRDSKEAQRAAEKQKASAAAGGMDAFLQQIESKRKVGRPVGRRDAVTSSRVAAPVQISILAACGLWLYGLSTSASNQLIWSIFLGSFSC